MSLAFYLTRRYFNGKWRVHMRNVFILAFGIVALMAMSGCGSLNQKVGGPSMPASTLEYANQMQSSSSHMSITSGEKELSTDKWASKVYPVFPIFYWSTLGKFTPEPSYGVRTSTVFFPLFVLVRDSLYDGRGQRLQFETAFNMVFVIGYEDRVTPKSSDFRTGLLWIPGIGPFLGVGPEFFQFFWIPFTDFK